MSQDLEAIFVELDRIALAVRKGEMPEATALETLTRLSAPFEEGARAGFRQYYTQVSSGRQPRRAPKPKHDIVALSLTPWWAWLVMGPHGEPSLKPLENRTWNTNRRGRFFVHASKGKEEHREEVVEFLVDRGLHDLARRLPGEEVLRGGILGHAYIRTVVSPHAREEEYEKALVPVEWRQWHMREQYAYVLDDIQRTEFIPCKGSQSFWPVPEDVKKALGIG